MIESMPVAIKGISLLTLLTLLLSGIGIHEAVHEPQQIIFTQNEIDPFVMDIQHRADLVYNVVNEVITQKNNYGTIAYKQTCEDSLAFIQTKRLDTNENYNTLSTDQKILVQNYRVYLKEAANVVVYTGSTGVVPDLSKMNDVRKKLN